ALLDSNFYVLGSTQASFRTRTCFASSKVNGARTSKPKITWTAKKDKLTKFNSKDLKAIFNNMDPQEFRSISKCTIAPKVLTILETAHKWYSNAKLVLKVLRSLTKCFSIKVTTIEKLVKDTNIMRIDKLIRSLQTFDMILEETKKGKVKTKENIALQHAS
ncbi:hypothetical protein Gotri_002385, partial [Gossypium trilobum]|nr:hypothetical protein [Gossypium trilobum]